MASRRLLFLDAGSLTAYHWQLSGPHQEAHFPATAEGIEAFAEYLGQHAASLFYLLADVAEEGFQIDDIPHVQGRDRQAIINRKLAQFFYGSPLVMAISRGRLAEARRDERLLFAGLTGYSAIEPWLQILRQAESRLAGLYSLPQIVAGLMAKRTGAASLLVMSISRAGVRQTFLDKGQLRFSRLSPMATANAQEVASACAAETNKIFQYLAGQRLIARDAPLQTLVLAHPAQFETFRAVCQDSRERQVELIDLLALARQYGLAQPPADSNGEVLFLHCLARQPPSQQFAPATDRHFHDLWRLRSAIQIGATALLAAGLLYAGGQAYTFSTLTADNQAMQAEIKAGQQHYESLLQGLPKVPLTPDQLRVLTDREQLLQQRSAGPRPLMQHISQALTRTPAVELMRLDWRLANNGDAEISRHATQSQPSANASSAGYAIVALQAQLPLAMVANHRQQLETINAFVAALSQQDVQVQVVSLPFETESGKSIRSSESASQIEPPRFQLRMVRKL